MADPAPRGEFVIVTGPSRTADIEKILILGVHGPKRLVVLLMGGIGIGLGMGMNGTECMRMQCKCVTGTVRQSPLALISFHCILHRNPFTLPLDPSSPSFIASWRLADPAPAPGRGPATRRLKKMPAELLRYTGGARPDAEGMVGYNRSGFKSPEFQCGAMRSMLRAVVRRTGRALTTVGGQLTPRFASRAPDGGFSHPGRPHGGPSAAAIWLAEADQAVLVLRESPLGPSTASGSPRWFPRSPRPPAGSPAPPPGAAQERRRRRAEPPAVRRLGLRALGRFDRRRRAEANRATFVELAMAQYRPADGVFLEKGGHDSSYQAVAALNLQVWLIYFPDKKLEAAAAAAVRWELGRIGPDGQVDVTGNTRTGLGQERWMGHRRK